MAGLKSLCESSEERDLSGRSRGRRFVWSDGKLPHSSQKRASTPAAKLPGTPGFHPSSKAAGDPGLEWGGPEGGDGKSDLRLQCVSPAGTARRIGDGRVAIDCCGTHRRRGCFRGTVPAALSICSSNWPVCFANRRPG